MDFEDETRRKKILEHADEIISSGRYSVRFKFNNLGSAFANTQSITGTMLASILALGTLVGFVISSSNKD